jgi:immune inhibitor A
LALFCISAIPLTLGAPKAPANYAPTDAGPRIRGSDIPVDLSSYAGTSSSSKEMAYETILDTRIWLILNDYAGSYNLAYFNLVAENDVAEIWIQNNIAWPAGDPRATPEISDEQIAYLLEEFTANIYPTLTDYFATPDFHDGSNAYLPSLVGLPADYFYDADGKFVILVSNIRDANYYDPTYPIYIAGFYSPSYEVYFDRNIVTIDAYDWANRLGPDGTRPYLYEGIVAHEMQHLIHDDFDPDEELFVNEGFSGFATWLCGYGHPTSHVDDARDLPENSLVVWGDQGDLEILSDYGHAYLWTMYLYQLYGTNFIKYLAQNPDSGITGIESTLDAFKKTKSFADLYHDWAVALLIDSNIAGGRYRLDNIDFKLNIGTPSDPNPEAFSTAGAGPWGTDYIWIDGNPKTLAKLTFNGIDYSMSPTAWTSDGEVLWSGTGDLIDNWAIFEATGGGTLTFDTLYDFEDYWDFGFVQVSTDGGYTWTSLENGYTTYDHDPNAHPKVIENLPGLTSYITEWVTMSFDLSAYAGQDILLAFRCVTDWATYYGGWYVDNVYVDGTLVSDGSSTDGFRDISEILPVNADFTVSFVGIKTKLRGNEYTVFTMKLDSVTESGLFELNKLLKNSDKAVMLVTFDAPEGFTSYADYTFDFTYANEGPKK